MKTLELNIGLHSKTLGTLNPVQIINALTGRGFTVTAYRVAQSTCEDGAEPCLAVRVATPTNADANNTYAALGKLAQDYGQDCIAFAGFAGPAKYTTFHAQYWISPDAPPALSECQAMQAKHLAKAEQITQEIISGMPAVYQDLLYQAAAKNYRARQSSQFISPFM